MAEKSWLQPTFGPGGHITSTAYFYSRLI